MKILVFNWRDLRHPEAGGAEVNIHQQAKRWVAGGHEVTLFTARPKGQASRDSIDGMELYRRGGRFTVYLWAVPLYLFKLRRRSDVILDIENGIPFFTPLYSRRPKVLLMHHLHQDQFLIEMGPVAGRMGRFMERVLVPLLYRRSVITAVSQSTARRKKAALRGGGGMKIEVIYNGLDHATYVPGKEKSIDPTVLYLGRIKRYKRLERLVAMMPEVRRIVPDARLVIAGDGDALDEVTGYAKASGAADAISMPGRVSEAEKVRLMQGAWVLATPSMNEGWGVTVLEANACGTPAVAFRVSGLDEAIVDGETGLLCDDEGSFSKALIQVLSDSDSRRRLSEGAMKWAGRFDWDETAGRMLEVLTRQSELKNSFSSK